MKKSIKILFLLIVCLYAQTWERTYGTGYRDEEGIKIIQKDNGNFILLANKHRCYPFPAYIWLMELDTLGNVLWERIFSNDDLSIDDLFENLFAYSFSLFDSHIFICGIAYNIAIIDSGIIFLFKTDSLGNIIWTRNYDDVVYLLRLAYARTGDILGAGRIGTIDTTDDVYISVRRVNSMGEVVWTRIFDQGEGTDIMPTNDNNFIVLGIVRDPFGPNDICLVKMTSSGDTIWKKTYGMGSGSSEVGYSITHSPDGGYVIAGATSYLGLVKAFLVKINENGDTLWTKTYGAPGCISRFFSIVTMPDGGYAMVGSIDMAGSIDRDVYLVRVDSIGNMLWSRTYGDIDYDAGVSLDRTNDGGFIITGWYTPPSPPGFIDLDVYVIKTDSLGGVDWVREIPINPESIHIVVSPNPFNSQCVVGIEGVDAKPYDIRIFDCAGNVVFSKTENEASKIIWNPEKYLPSGIYIVQVKTDVQTQSQKVVLIK